MFNESPNLSEETCQGSGSGELSGEGSGEETAEDSIDDQAEGSASGLAESSGEGSAEEEANVGEFRCSTGRNISEFYVCDGEKDCPGRGEDETYEAFFVFSNIGKRSRSQTFI